MTFCRKCGVRFEDDGENICKCRVCRSAISPLCEDCCDNERDSLGFSRDPGDGYDMAALFDPLEPSDHCRY